MACSEALAEQLKTPDIDSLSFEERLGLLVDCELTERDDMRSTLVTSQMPVDNWHELIGDPTPADAILGRLVHFAYRINLKGESMRKGTKKLTAPDASD